MKNIFKDKRKVFVAVWAIIGIFALMYCVKPTAKTVFSAFAATERKLPIYCVETEKKQVAISFDAAWGAGIYRGFKYLKYD
ncbi:MAG: hypothetical protein PHY44_03730 [Lachnospiraceae bacterium]|nr:hypothetical protein [Lachnospiraceae bacterium]